MLSFEGFHDDMALRAISTMDAGEVLEEDRPVLWTGGDQRLANGQQGCEGEKCNGVFHGPMLRMVKLSVYTGNSLSGWPLAWSAEALPAPYQRSCQTTSSTVRPTARSVS